MRSYEELRTTAQLGYTVEISRSLSVLTGLYLQAFKSWRDTGNVKLSPITGIFGSSSSGKTSLLQALLLLKQTVENSDRSTVLHFGDKTTAVDLGDYKNVIHRQRISRSLAISIKWKPRRNFTYYPYYFFRGKDVDEVEFFIKSAIGRSFDTEIEEMWYQIAGEKIGMITDLQNPEIIQDKRYLFLDESKKFDPILSPSRSGNSFSELRLPRPNKCYGFPSEIQKYIKRADHLSDLALAFEKCLQDVYYLGPLRDFPKRQYVWSGSRPTDVGAAGEYVVEAMLSSKIRGEPVVEGESFTLEQYVANWLKKLGLIHGLRVRSIEEANSIFEIRVQRSAGGVEAHLPDVGFGVSQVLPVLVLCYYVPAGSTIILEQPEIHLHPAVQSGLADVLIEVWRKRRIQIILESHSEHLLRRLQRRIAEEKVSTDEVSLYFCRSNQDESHLDSLELDEYGNITNWPENFFGDEFGEIAAMSDAVFQRKDETNR